MDIVIHPVQHHALDRHGDFFGSNKSGDRRPTYSFPLFSTLSRQPPLTSRRVEPSRVNCRLIVHFGTAAAPWLRLMRASRTFGILLLLSQLQSWRSPDFHLRGPPIRRLAFRPMTLAGPPKASAPSFFPRRFAAPRGRCASKKLTLRLLRSASAPRGSGRPPAVITVRHRRRMVLRRDEKGERHDCNWICHQTG